MRALWALLFVLIYLLVKSSAVFHVILHCALAPCQWGALNQNSTINDKARRPKAAALNLE